MIHWFDFCAYSSALAFALAARCCAAASPAAYASVWASAASTWASAAAFSACESATFCWSWMRVSEPWSAFSQNEIASRSAPMANWQKFAATDCR